MKQQPMTDREIVEQCVPAHMIVLMLEECEKIGGEMRPDVKHSLNLASVVPMKKAGLDMLGVRRVATRVDALARTLLHDMNPADPRDGLFSSAMFVLTLVDEGRFDPKGNAVPCALLMLEDVREEHRSDALEPYWHSREADWKKKAKHLLTRANLLGYFLHELLQSIAPGQVLH